MKFFLDILAFVLWAIIILLLLAYFIPRIL